MLDFISQTWTDIRFAFRTFAKAPGFAGVSVLAIALGVGPNSAVFSIIHAVLLRPLPVGNADRLVAIWETQKSRGLDQISVSGPSLADWQREAHSFSAMMPGQASPEYGFNLTTGGEPERVLGARAGANFADVLGIAPVLGRSFVPDEGRPGGANVALISYQLWQRRFGGNPGIVGKPIGLDGMTYTVIGVLPPDLRSMGSVDVWTPVTDDLTHQPRRDHRYGVLARLKDGVTVAQAQAEMNAITERLARQYPESNKGVGAIIIPANTIIFGAIRPAFVVLFGAVLLLLLIACANVAGLLLARGAARRNELAVRAALGASSGRIVRQLLAESALLALVGGASGLLLASWSIDALRRALPDVIPRLQEMEINIAVLAFTLTASLVTGMLFGIFPALRGVRTPVIDVLKQGGGRGSAGGHGPRSALLMGEVALAVVLLTAAGLLIHSFVNITSVDPGFRAAHLLTMRLNLPKSKYSDPAKRAAFTRSVLRRVAALPGVRSASTVDVLPMRTYFLNLPANVRPYQIEGQTPVPLEEQPTGDYRIVSRAFLGAMGVRLVRGREFSEHDDQSAPNVAMVNETLARRCCPGEDVIGKHIRIAGRVREIVGVIPDIRLGGLDKTVRPATYAPNDQEPSPVFSLVVRTMSDPRALGGPVQREIQAEDSEQPVSDVRPMEQVISDSLLLRRLSMSLLAVFAALALLLAGVGIYALIAYTVSRRTPEIGLRMALGADRKQIMRLVVGRGLVVGMVGVAIGVPAALSVTRLMRNLLFGVSAFDPVVFMGVPLLLLFIAALASYVPARKAMRVDPTIALRYE